MFLLLACPCLRVHGDVEELLRPAQVLLPRSLAAFMLTREITKLVASGRLLESLVGVQHEFERLPDCTHPRAEAVLGDVEVL